MGKIQKIVKAIPAVLGFTWAVIAPYIYTDKYFALIGGLGGLTAGFFTTAYLILFTGEK